MTIYELDGALMRWEADFHGQTQKVLGFFSGYGRNLDALFDVLQDTSGLMAAEKPCRVVWRHSQRAREAFGSERFDAIVACFRDSPVELVLE